jgi:hypothetical protein
MAGVLTHPGPLSGLFPVSELSADYCSSLFSQAWLAMPQLVLHALWQEVWHSPQLPF